jgi:hypothetical protein
MIENLDDYLIGFAIGVRFKQNFSIQDNYGKIADKLLYSEDSIFSPTVFPKLTTPPSEKLILVNEDVNDKFVFDKANAILEINFAEESTFNKGSLPNLIEAYDNQVIKGILKDLSISRIVRVGYIRKYKFNDSDLVNTLIYRVCGDETTKIKDINIRFSKSIPIGEAVALREKNDYKNAIFTIIKKSNDEDEENLIITLDYQRFYVPNLSTSSQIKFIPFIKNAKEFNSDEFLEWLNKYYLEGENE